MSKYTKGFSDGVLNAMERVETAIREDIARVLGGKGAIIAQAPAGAGKSQLIARLVGELRQKKAVVAVACPTNEQAYSLVERIATLNPRLPVCFTPATGRELPAHIARLPMVTQLKARDAQAAPLVVATMNKFADSVERYGTRYDVLLIDEAYQADSARYFAVAGMADTHLLVGDSGQLDCRRRFGEESSLDSATSAARNVSARHPRCAAGEMLLSDASVRSGSAARHAASVCGPRRRWKTRCRV
jgi:hypothetical protein